MCPILCKLCGHNFDLRPSPLALFKLQCIRAKTCNEWNAGTDSGVSMTFQLPGPDDTKCTTNKLDRDVIDDWVYDIRYEFCGHKWLGDCYDKQILAPCEYPSCKTQSISVYLEEYWWQLGIHDNLCLDYVILSPERGSGFRPGLDMCKQCGWWDPPRK